MYTREDKQVIIQNPDGTMVVEHTDGSRITTMNQKLNAPSENEQETGIVLIAVKTGIK